MASDTVERDAQLGRMLSALVEAPRPRRRLGAVVAGAIAAFALAGATTGVLTAGALAGDAQREQTLRAVAMTGLSGGHLDGVPVYLEASGSATLALGSAPHPDDEIALGLECLTADTVGWKVGPASESRTDCRGDAPIAGGAVDESRGGELALRGDGGYAVWASWYRPAPVAPASKAQRAALADGEVRRQEYLDGWSRLVGCMSTAGVDLGTVPTTAPLVQFGIPAEHVLVFDNVCYPREFEQIDGAWQLATDKRFIRCFASRGLSDPGEYTGRMQALRDAGIRPEDCGLLG